jgi:hypothetical protein
MNQTERLALVESQLTTVGQQLADLKWHAIESITGKCGQAEKFAQDERVFVRDELKPARRTDVQAGDDFIRRELHKLIDRVAGLEPCKDAVQYLAQRHDHLQQTIGEERNRQQKEQKDLAFMVDSVKTANREHREDYDAFAEAMFDRLTIAESLLDLTVWQRLRWLFTGRV